MEILRFAHHFFHFESTAWKRATSGKEASWAFAQRLFRENVFPRRQLRISSPVTFEAARVLHEKQLASDEALGIRALSENCSEFPGAIAQFIAPENRPALLYIRGNEIPREQNLVAVVGTRQPSENGREAAHSFSSYFGAIGIQVVSGLARGIDTIAHEQSLSLGTVAVLGGGVGDVYPQQNRELASRILENGGSLLSPFPEGQVPLPQNFPERNLLIAALAAGTLVVEGAEKSGASITGRQALSMGKTVVALAQDFRTEFGRGAIRLSQEGATLVVREEEAVEAIYRRFGGFQGQLPPPGSSLKPSRRSFTFSEFQASVNAPVPEALALLEEGILLGKIERWGSRFRLR